MRTPFQYIKQVIALFLTLFLINQAKAEIPYFEKISGQINPTEVRYLLNEAQYTVHFYKNKIQFIDNNNLLSEIKFKESKQDVVLHLKQPLSDDNKYSELYYSALYEGIDLRFYYHNNQLEYDFIVAAHADPKSIKMLFNAEKIIFNQNADNIRPLNGLISHQALFVYQNVNHIKQSISSRFVMNEDSVQFAIGNYDHSRALVIDPKIVYVKQIPVVIDNFVNLVVTHDKFNNAYYLETGDYQKSDGKITLTKVSEDNKSIKFSSVFQGANNDVGEVIRVDDKMNIYIAGGTTSVDFPIKDANQSELNQGDGVRRRDAFIMKIAANGKDILYSSYFGSSGDEEIEDMVIKNGYLYALGLTSSLDYPTETAPDGSLSIGNDYFLVKIRLDDIQILYNKKLGINQRNEVGVIVSDLGDVYVAGTHDRDTLVTKNAYQAEHAGHLSSGDLFIIGLDNQGEIQFSTYFGGSGYNYFADLAVTPSGEVLVLGNISTIPGKPFDFPLKNAYSSDYKGHYDSCIVKMNRKGELLYSSLYGGTGNEIGQYIVTGDDAYTIVGTTDSNDLPEVGVSFQNGRLNTNSDDLYLARFTMSGQALEYATYLGANADYYRLNTVEMIADDVLILSRFQNNSVELTETFPSENNKVFARVRISDEAAEATQANVSMQMLKASERHLLGDASSYTLEIFNHGPLTATDVNIAQTLVIAAGVDILSVTANAISCPTDIPLTCFLGDIAPGENVIVKLEFKAKGIGKLTYQGNVTSSEKDKNLANNTVEYVHSTVSSPDKIARIAIDFIDTESTVKQHEKVPVHIRITNEGPSKMDALSMEYYFQDDGDVYNINSARLVSKKNDQGFCFKKYVFTGGPIKGWFLRCNIKPLPVNASANIKIVLNIKRQKGDTSVHAVDLDSAGEIENWGENGDELLVNAISDRLSTLKITVFGKGTVEYQTDIVSKNRIQCPGECKSTFPENKVFILKAIPKPGYRLKKWIGACRKAKSDECQLSLTGNAWVMAIFSKER